MIPQPLFFLVDGVWDAWGAWTACSETCKPGTKTRDRTCIEPTNGGKPCTHDSTLYSGDASSETETAKCNDPGIYVIVFLF